MLIIAVGESLNYEVIESQNLISVLYSLIWTNYYLFLTLSSMVAEMGTVVVQRLDFEEVQIGYFD